MNTPKSTKMTRNKLTPNAPNQDRSNIFRTKLKSTNATFLAPQTHQNHKNHTGFIAFFENLVFAKLVPFPAVPNGSRNQIFRRRSKHIKTKLKSTNVAFWTPPTNQKRAILARTCAKSRFPRPEPIFSWISIFATRLTKYRSNVFKTKLKSTTATFSAPQSHHNLKNR